MWNSISNFDRMFMTPNVLHRRMASMMNHQQAQCSRAVGENDVAMNLYDDETSFRLVALIPGVAKDDVEIQIKGRHLELSASRSVKVPEGYKEHGRQRAPLVSKRSCKLPVDVQADHVTATLESGVLTLIIPKVEKVAATKIVIQ